MCNLGTQVASEVLKDACLAFYRVIVGLSCPQHVQVERQPPLGRLDQQKTSIYLAQLTERLVVDVIIKVSCICWISKIWFEGRGLEVQSLELHATKPS